MGGQMGTTVRPKVRRPSAAAPIKIERLSEGDHIEMALTVEYKHPKHGSFWPKFGASTTIREGETEEEARDRLREVVLEEINQQIAGFKS